MTATSSARARPSRSTPRRGAEGDDPDDEPIVATELVALGTLVREKRKVWRFSRFSELVPNDDGVVHGPTFAEIVVTLMEHAAWAPLIGLGTFIALVFVENLTGLPACPTSVKSWLSATTTVIFALSIVRLRRYLRARPLLQVRTRIFEPDKEPYVPVTLCCVYAAIAAMIYAR